ncbi:hypothetical protein [Bradyrhizobium sp. LHD-71]|nr:hypothetical protein [Bradyrhizobium sp. LHD-71]MDQ8727215.1 hypothetical protein [Bradyrhizobium sp. LHD-71]
MKNKYDPTNFFSRTRTSGRRRKRRANASFDRGF